MKITKRVNDRCLISLTKLSLSEKIGALIRLLYSAKQCGNISAIKETENGKDLLLTKISCTRKSEGSP